MAGFKEWLRRLRRPASPNVAHTSVSIQETINGALARAGLLPQTQTPTVARAPVPEYKPARDVDAQPGQFLWRDSGALRYKLFVPQSYASGHVAVPLIVMLHGCTQDPDDFAVGTQMNALAEERTAIIAYPQQTALANPNKCWNWFRPEDQRRNSGEPERIAAMVRQITADYNVDTRRVFVAGMSAGAAMAVILGRCYPELFAGIAVHSGLPYRCANNVVSALSVMRDARAGTDTQAREALAMPTFVICGDSDETVNPANSDAIVRETLRDWPANDPLTREATSISTGGRTSACTSYRNGRGNTVVTLCKVSSGGHRWFGGDTRGSHTDANGPPASELIMKFFEDQAQA